MADTPVLNRKARQTQGRKPRLGEKIGGGFVVASRIGEMGRIVMSRVPYEHENLEDAKAQAERLAKENPAIRYFVLAVASDIFSAS